MLSINTNIVCSNCWDKVVMSTDDVRFVITLTCSCKVDTYELIKRDETIKKVV